MEFEGLFNLNSTDFDKSLLAILMDFSAGWLVSGGSYIVSYESLCLSHVPKKKLPIF